MAVYFYIAFIYLIDMHTICSSYRRNKGVEIQLRAKPLSEVQNTLEFQRKTFTKNRLDVKNIL